MSKRLNKAADFSKSGADTGAIEAVSRRYAVGATSNVIEAMTSADPNSDPVARQYIPMLDELKILPQERTDPIGDDVHSPVKGIIHRYPDRVLFSPVNVCAVYCRYCFRREKVGPGADVLNVRERDAALDYIRSNSDIWEVILTGGDPLVLAPRHLRDIITALNDIDHIQVIRIHSRVPIADPERVTYKTCSALQSEKALYIALHINHAQEITPAARMAVKSLHESGAVLVSQSVLLKGVNDDAEVLENLFKALVAMRVKPYYLHHPDMAPGTSHFRLSIERGQALVKDIQGRISGLCQPHYVLDIPGGHGKAPIGPDYIKTIDERGYEIENYEGFTYHYPKEGFIR